VQFKGPYKQWYSVARKFREVSDRKTSILKKGGSGHALLAESSEDEQDTVIIHPSL